MNNNVKLLPLGSRVTHFDGGASTHGKGTIVAYNGVCESNYIKNNLGKVLDDAGKAGLGGFVAGAVVPSMYSGDRYPYVVQFDPAVGLSDWACQKRLAYPRGYKDVYEPESIRLLETEPNVLNDSITNYVIREWLEDAGEWSDWQAIGKEQYEAYRNNKQYQCIARL